MKKDFALTYIFQWTMIMSYLGCISSDNLMCSLSIYADNTLYQSFNKTPIQHRRAAITRLIENIISDANAIFMEKKNKILISRSPDGKLYKQIQLIIRKITIFDDYRCSNINNFSEEEKILCNDKVGSSVLLNEISKKDLSNFCLGYIFTNRDFEGDIVGLAWIKKEEFVITMNDIETEKDLTILESLRQGISAFLEKL
ncbi:hypothetical protein A3Q56_02235 [Intoshia linei]|uniref:Uncharacterized protein n=1 Tax=Intoshia linei TaxID=1819745 RepID=A0A177B8K4_9BILA|nr:hypothetical protein A3Q56_02235 [Intoshia linei]